MAERVKLRLDQLERRSVKTEKKKLKMVLFVTDSIQFTH